MDKKKLISLGEIQDYIEELETEIDEALSIINRFANFDIHNERADALHMAKRYMVAVRFLDKHGYKGE